MRSSLNVRASPSIVQLWTDPVVHWQTGFDSVAHHRRLLAEGELLATWPPAPFEHSSTDCFKVGQQYWIWQIGVGGFRFRGDHPEFLACPSRNIPRSWFESLIIRGWLPAVYPLWGRQVLHASAVVRRASGEVIAFAGPSGAGKSTIAFGLGRRRGWAHVCDDTLAFSCSEGRAANEIALHPMQNEARLRSQSAAYFGKADNPVSPLSWPEGPLTLKQIYHLDPLSEQETTIAAVITKLKPASSYPLLLEQAQTLTLKIPHYNQRLMRDYLSLTAAIPSFRLTYRRSFDAVEEVFDAVERHILSSEEPTLSAR